MATLKQQRFALELALDDGRSGTALALAAGYAEVSAANEASRCMRNDEVLALAAERRKELAAKAGLDPTWVLAKLKAIASADHRKFSQTRIGCCRHCYGIDHEYQWTKGEFSKEQSDALRDDKPGPQFLGGLGYDKKLPPVEDCPNCAGEGITRVVMFDTRSLDDDTAVAYLGTKKTKDGLEQMKADKVKALEMIGRHLGMWNDKMALTNPDGTGPAQINHAHLHAKVATATDAKQLTEAELTAYLLGELEKRENESLGVPLGVSSEPKELSALRAPTYEAN